MSTKKTISIIKILAMILCAAGVLFGSAAILRQQLVYKENERITEAAIQTAVRPKPSQLPEVNPISPADSISVSADPNIEWLSSVNMDELRTVNPEVIGWIWIPGTSISHPLLQTTDNAYYLKHAWDGTKNSCGAVFIDFRSSPDDWNAVIYGHNMRNGSMFAEIRRYQNREFMQEHPLMYNITA